MSTWITGVLSVTAAAAFLGFLAYRIDETPLWIAIGVGIASMAADLLITARDRNA